jgi:hypothetical protein
MGASPAPGSPEKIHAMASPIRFMRRPPPAGGNPAVPADAVRATTA